MPSNFGIAKAELTLASMKSEKCDIKNGFHTRFRKQVAVFLLNGISTSFLRIPSAKNSYKVRPLNVNRNAHRFIQFYSPMKLSKQIKRFI